MYLYDRPLIPGHLLRRYKRFFADIELQSGEVIIAHCPNTGPMTGVCQIGSPVQVSFHPSPKRQLAYTWEMIYVDQVWVGINTSLPNRLIRYGLEQNWFAELTGFEKLQREVAYGRQNSKIDFLLTYPDQQAYVEVKNTTWAQGSLALFPDTETTRGQKHIEELIEVVEQGYRGVLLYVIHRGDCPRFAPGDQKDRRYGELLRQADASGVEILPYRFQVSPEGITYLGLAEVDLDRTEGD